MFRLWESRGTGQCLKVGSTNCHMSISLGPFFVGDSYVVDGTCCNVKSAMYNLFYEEVHCCVYHCDELYGIICNLQSHDLNFRF